MGDPHTGAAAVAALLMIGLVGLYVWSIVWAYGDAVARGKSGLLVALLVALLSWPCGWLAWLIFRPSRRVPARSGPIGY